MAMAASDRTISPTGTAVHRRAGSRGLGLAALLLATAGGMALPGGAAAPGAAGAPCTPLAVRAALQEPKAGDVYMQPGSATCERAEVEIAGRGLAGIFTASFTVRYPAALLRYEGYSTGTLLSRGDPATPPLYLVRTPGPGLLVVTMTRFAPDAGVSIEGDAVFLGLRFARLAAGVAGIDFDRGSVGVGPVRLLGAAGQTIAARAGPGHGASVNIP
jgi:hypothetical protein